MILKNLQNWKTGVENFSVSQSLKLLDPIFNLPKLKIIENFLLKKIKNSFWIKFRSQITG